MNTNDNSLATCQEINRRVKVAETHQLEYYSAVKVPARSKYTQWKQVWGFVTSLAAGLSNMKPGQQPAQTGFTKIES